MTGSDFAGVALTQAVERGNFTGEGAEGGDLHILFPGDLLHEQIVVAKGLLLGANLVIVGSLEQHASIGASHAGDGEEANEGGRDKHVGVVQRNGDLAEAAVVFTGDKNDVVAFAHRAPPFASMIRFWFANITPMRMRFAGTHSHPTKVGKTAAT